MLNKKNNSPSTESIVEIGKRLKSNRNKFNNINRIITDVVLKYTVSSILHNKEEK